MDAPAQNQIQAYGNYLRSQGVSDDQVKGYTDYLNSQYSGSAATDGSAPAEASSNPVRNFGPTPQMKQFVGQSLKDFNPSQSTNYAQNMWDAFRKVGLDESTLGLGIRQKMPEESLPPNASIGMQAAAQVGELVGDIPAMALGAVGGSTFGPAGTAAGAFAVPMAIRKMLIDHIQRGDVTTTQEFVHRLLGTVWAGTKGAITGVATALAPEALGMAGEAIGGGIGSTFSSIANNSLGRLGTELATMNTVGSALEGRLPKADDFVTGALTLGALHGIGMVTGLTDEDVKPVTKKLQNIYASTGVTPDQVVDEASRDVQVRQELLDPDPSVPKEAQSTSLVPREDGGWALTQEKYNELTNNAEPPKDENFEKGSVEDRVLNTIVSKGNEEDKTPILSQIGSGVRKLRQYFEDVLSPITQATNEAEKLRAENGSGNEPPSGDKMLIGTGASGEKYLVTQDQINKALNGKFDPSKNPAIQAQLFRGGIDSKVLSTLVHGVYDFNDPNKRVGPSFVDVTKTIKRGREKLADAFLKSLATISDNKERETGISRDDAEEFVRKYKDEFAPLARAAHSYNESLLKFLVDSGVVSKENAEAARENRFFYAPMYRELNIDPMFELRKGPGASPFQKFEGSDLKTYSALQMMAENANAIIRAGERNRVLQTIADTKEFQDLGYLKRVPEGTGQLKNEFSVKVNGNTERWAAEPMFARAVQELNYDPDMAKFWASGVGKVMRKFAEIKRVTLTANPVFALKHGLRSEIAADIQSSEFHVPFASVLQTIHEQLGGSEDFWKAMKNGALNSGFEDIDHILSGQSWGKDLSLSGKLKALMSNKFDDPAYKSAWNVVGSRLRAMEVLTQVLDNAPRLREFQKLGGTEGNYDTQVKAAYAARNVSVDYMKQGIATKFLNAGEPFLGVDIAGTFRAIESLKDPKVIAKALTLITLPEIVNFAINHKDERYKQKPDWYHGAFMYMPLPGRHDISIPRVFTLGLIYGSFAHMVMRRLVDQDPNAFDNLVAQIGEKAFPIGLPTIAAPMAEQYMNKNMFTGRPLVPDIMQKLLPQYQYEPYTSDTAKAVGKLLGFIPGVRNIGPDGATLSSPLVIDNYFRDWGGTMGQYALGILDSGLRAAGMASDKPIDELPGVRRFYSRVSPNQEQSVVDFRNNFSDLDKTASTLSWLKYKARNDGDKDAMNQAMDIYKNFNEPLYAEMASINKGMKQASKALWAIQNGDMSSTDKQQLTDAIMSRMIEGAERGNQIYYQMKGH